VPLTKVHGNQEEANEDVIMTAKTEAGANRRSHEMKETVNKAKSGAKRASEELKVTAKAAAGANRPSEILEEAVKPTTIPDPQDHPCVAEIPTTMTRRDAMGPGRTRLGPDPRRKTRLKDLQESISHKHSRSGKDHGGRRARSLRSASV
jgi:hypothetical protein